MRKINHLKTCVAMLAVLVPGAAFSHDGTINLSGTFVVSTCSVTTANIDRRFPTFLKVADFRGIGTTSGWGPDFTISLNCASSGAAVYMVLSDATTPANRTSTLSLTAGSNAQGVGIQIWKSGGANALNYGPDSAAAGTQNQFLVYNANGNAVQNVDLVFSWRYIQTAAAVTAGSANGNATFTMSYQ